MQSLHFPPLLIPFPLSSNKPRRQHRHASGTALASPSRDTVFGLISTQDMMPEHTISWVVDSSLGARMRPETSVSQSLGSADRENTWLSLSGQDTFHRITPVENELCPEYGCCGMILRGVRMLVEPLEETHDAVIDWSSTHNPSVFHQLPHFVARYLQSTKLSRCSIPGQAPPENALSSFSASSSLWPPSTSTFITHGLNNPPPHSARGGQLLETHPGPLSAFSNTTAFAPLHIGTQRAPEIHVSSLATVNNVQHREDMNAIPATPSNRLDNDNTWAVREPFTSEVTAQAISCASSHAKPTRAGIPSPNDRGTFAMLRRSTTFSCPPSSRMLSKPFHCPNPACYKSYKQANGLKYHLNHGSCAVTPTRDVETVRALLAEKGLPGEGVLIPEHDTQDLKHEVECRLRPFVCAVGGCERRFQHMRDLHRHYKCRGKHGGEGLRLLANSQREALKSRWHQPRKSFLEQAAPFMHVLVFPGNDAAQT